MSDSQDGASRSDREAHALRDLTVVRNAAFAEADVNSTLAFVPWDEVKTWFTLRAFPRYVLRFRDVSLLTYRLDTLRRPLASAIAMRLLARRRVTFVDETGREDRITIGRLVSNAVALVRDRASVMTLTVRTRRKIAELGAPVPRSPLSRGSAPVYRRTDPVFGDSVRRLGGAHLRCREPPGRDWPIPPVFITSDDIEGVGSAIEKHVVEPGARYWDSERYLRLPTTRQSQSGLAGSWVTGARPSYVSATRLITTQGCFSLITIASRLFSSTTARRSG